MASQGGVYAQPGKNFQSSCDERDDITIDLSGKSVNRSEWGCDVKELVDLAPGSLKVELTCGDYNLAQNLDPRDPNWENRHLKEVMFIKRLDETTISVQKSLNSRNVARNSATRSLRSPGTRSLLPRDEVQRAYAGQRQTGKQSKKVQKN